MTYITCDKDQFSSQVCFAKMLATLLVWIAQESLGEFDFSYLHSAYDDSLIKISYGIHEKICILPLYLQYILPKYMFQSRVFLDRLQEQIRHQFRWNRQPLYEIRIRMYEDESYLFDERFNKWNIGLLGTASNWWRHSRRCFTLSSAMKLENFFIQIIVLSYVRLDLFVLLTIFLLVLETSCKSYKCRRY